MLSTLTLTPGPLQIFVAGKAGRAWKRKLTYAQQPVANKLEVYEKSPVWLGWLMIVNVLITLANETFININFDDGNCIVIKKFVK